LRDRPTPRIKDPTVLGVFRNATDKPLLVGLHPCSGGETEFILKPQEVDVNPIQEGAVIATPALGADDAPLSERTAGKPIAKYEIRFRQLLPVNYEYSPEWSDERTLYYRITSDGIELVPASQAKGRAEAAGRKIPTKVETDETKKGKRGQKRGKGKRGQSQVSTHISIGYIPWHDGQTVAHRVSGGNLSCA